MKLMYHGHSAVSIETKKGYKLLIDPFVTGNKLTDLKVSDVKADFILITHGHQDHVGDMVAIAKSNNATVIACPEITHFAEVNGIEKTHGMNIGGSFDFPFGKVKMVFAQHSSGYADGNQMLYMGEPSGFVLSIDDKNIYHAGDTAYFSDLSLIKEDFEIDVALLPIGDNFTMGIKDAVKAAKSIGAKKSIPIHFDTFPVIKQNPTEFVSLLPENSGQVLAVGENLDI